MIAVKPMTVPEALGRLSAAFRQPWPGRVKLDLAFRAAEWLYDYAKGTPAQAEAHPLLFTACHLINTSYTKMPACGQVLVLALGEALALAAPAELKEVA